MTPADLIETELRKHLRLSLGERALADLMSGNAVMLSGREAETAALLAVRVLAAELRAEGERERERLHDKLHELAIHNWVTSWEMIANWLEGQPRGQVVIVNRPGEARDSR